MKTTIKRLTGLMLVIAMLLTMMPVAFSASPAEFVDFPTGWSKIAMEAAVNNGLLSGYENNEIRPEANLTRAEMAAIIVRSFGAKTRADISVYSDVSSSEWYYDYIAKAVKMGALNGISATQMAPDAYITREELFTAIARVLVLSSDNTAALDKFPDKAQISSWAVNHMAALAERGYVNGDESGKANPKAYITREEFAQFMHNAIRTYIAEPGTYTNDMTGITVVRVGGVTLSGFTNTSDIVIGDGVLEGSVLISNVKIEERLLTRGGTITLKNTTVGDKVVVNNVNGVTYFKNYRNEKVFNGLVENTPARFLTRTGGGGSSSPSTPDDKIYTITFMVDGSVYDTVTVTNGVLDHTPVDPTKAEHTFDGWFDVNGKKVTDFAAVTSDMTLTAKFTKIQPGDKIYTITFMVDGSVYGTVTVKNGVVIGNIPADPTKTGYTFIGWYDGNGNKVEDFAAVTSDKTLTAKFDINVYKVHYNANFEAGYTYDTEYTIENIIALALISKVIAPSGQYCSYWKDANGNRVSALSVTDSTPEVLQLYPHFENVPASPVKVTFYEGFYEDIDFIMGISQINSGETVPTDKIPEITENMYQKGYKENAGIASVYEGKEEYIHKIKPSFWYVDEQTNKLVPFDEKVVITKDTSVYMLNEALSLYLTFLSENQALSVTAYYNDETRVLNSVKDMMVSGREQLDKALLYDMIPKYDEITDELINKLSSIGIIDSNKNIKVLNIPIPISKLIKEEIANSMIRQYIRNVVQNEAELNKILSLIDVKEFASQFDIEDIIASMTDAEIAELIKSAEYKDDITAFILEDIKKDDSVMVDLIIGYVTDIDKLIAELKDTKASSMLKTEAIKYIKEQLNDSKSALYSKFITMVKADLASANSVVMPAVVKYVKETLPASTTEAAELRKAVLTSSKLPDILKNDTVKAEIIKLALTDSFIDKALSDVAYREFLVEAVIDDADFINTLLNAPQFHNYIVNQLHGDNNLAKDVKALINTESKFKSHILDVVKHDTNFLGLLKTYPKLKQVVMDSMSWDKFVSSDDELFKYIFRQGSTTGTYAFIDLDDVETMIAEEYNKTTEAQYTGKYEYLDENTKKTIRTNLYNDPSVRATILAKIKNEFDKYKTEILDKFIDGKADEITDKKVHDLIDSLLVDYINKYINKGKLHTEKDINDAIEKAIEEILFSFIGDLIKGTDIQDSGLEAELKNMLDHIDTVKHAFVVDATPEVVNELKTIVKSYKTTHETQLTKIITDNYAELVNEVTVLVNPDKTNNIYSDVEKVLIEKASKIEDALISGYVNSISDDDLSKLIGQYIPKLTTNDINTYVATFLNASKDNEDAFRTELNALLESDTFIKSYLKDPGNKLEIENAISEFIANVDASFVRTNRAIITEALKSLDLSAFVDEETIKNYVKGLNENEKKAFADKIFTALQNDTNYKTFMHSLMNKDTFEVNKSNLTMVTAISGAIRGLTYEEVMGETDNAAINKLLEILGEDFIKGYFDTMKNDYCDGLDAVINEVTASSSMSIKKNYTTALNLEVDIINDVYKKLYEKAIPRVIEKLEAANIYYNENEYLKFLVNHDILSYLVDGSSSLATDELTGYSLKGVLDYYDYILMLLIVGDDALCWYGDENELSEEKFEALYDAMFGKVFVAHNKLNELLEAYEADGTLPTKVQNVISKVKKINDLLIKHNDKIKAAINKYFNSSINLKFEDGSIADDERVIKVSDFIFGKEEPVINIDTIYALFYSYDDTVQKKLQELIDSGKLDKAIAKFESTSFGELFSGKGKLGTVGEKLDEFKQNGKIESAIDSVYDLLVIIAKEGIEPFRTDKDKVDVMDAYEVTVGQINFKVKRYFK